MARSHTKRTADPVGQVISFKVNGDVTGKLTEHAGDIPVPEGSDPLSMHQAARAFMIKGLEAHIAEQEEEG